MLTASMQNSPVDVDSMVTALSGAFTNIALNFILGFDKSKEITDYHLVCLDTVPLVQEGILEEELDKVFGVK